MFRKEYHHSTTWFFKGSQVGCTEIYPPLYRPLVLVNFALEKTLFGNSAKTNHFFNIIFYALLCVLIYKFLRRIFYNYPVYLSFFITILFILHPLHTEVVANIKSRDELLCMLFGMMSLNFSIEYKLKNRISDFIYSLITFFLCVMSKESGFSFLGLIIIVYYFFYNETLKKLLLRSIPFIAISAFCIWMRYHSLGFMLSKEKITVMQNSLMAATSISEQWATKFSMLFHALLLLIFPVTLSWDYSYNYFPIVGWDDSTVITSLIIYITLLFITLMGIKSKKILSFTILFFIVSFFITSNLIIKVIGSPFGERFLFTPSLSFCIAFPFIAGTILRIDLKKSTFSNAGKVVVSMIVVIVLYSFITINRIPVWKNDYTLSESGITTSPQSARAHFSFANIIFQKMMIATDQEEKLITAKQALDEFENGLKIYDKDPTVYSIFYNMAICYSTLGNDKEAIHKYEQSIQIKPDLGLAYNNIGFIYFQGKDYTKALDYFIKATEVQKEYYKSFANAGACYQMTGDNKNAILYFEKALELNPSETGIASSLKTLYEAIGDTAKANAIGMQ